DGWLNQPGRGVVMGVDQELSPSNILPSPPRREPSSLPPALLASTRPARRAKGRDWSQIFPGPVRVAKKRPSPPKRVFLKPPTNWMSKETDGVKQTTQPVS